MSDELEKIVIVNDNNVVDAPVVLPRIFSSYSVEPAGTLQLVCSVDMFRIGQSETRLSHSLGLGIAIPR
jgi:hypothetical protein